MGQEKRSFGVRIDPDLYAAIGQQAKREGRAPANLGEVLLTWAFKQLRLAGNSLALIEMDVDPTTSKGPRGVRGEVSEILSKKK